MSTYDSRLEGREEIAEGTMAFHFSKPPGFSFKPGQAIELVLCDAAGSDGAACRHAFSLACAPGEERLSIATRMRDSAYKRRLKALPVGAPVALDGPFGSLTLHRDPARPAVLIAGGIGITPFISMLRQAAHEQRAQDLILVYANRRPEDAAFLAELQQLETRNRRFRLSATMTQLGGSEQAWTGRSGAVDQELLREIGDGLAAPIYYLAGPPAMVEGLRQVLEQIGIDDEDIRDEAFYGY